MMIKIFSGLFAFLLLVLYLKESKINKIQAENERVEAAFNLQVLENEKAVSEFAKQVKRLKFDSSVIIDKLNADAKDQKKRSEMSIIYAQNVLNDQILIQDRFLNNKNKLERLTDENNNECLGSFIPYDVLDWLQSVSSSDGLQR